VSWRRLRWRLRGAWLWPAFAVATFLAGLSLHLMPVQGLRTGLVAGLLIAGFVNLAAVALGMPLGGRLLRRGRDLPPVVAQDYGGCIALAVVLVLVVALGAVHHRAITDEERAAARALELVRHTVERSGPAEARRNVRAADTIRVEAGRVYRSCIPTSRPERPYCLVVHLDTQPVRVLYGGREPNDRWTVR
jgi:uncharacterized protein (DUF697 family)